MDLIPPANRGLPAAPVTAEQVNSSIRYTGYLVYRRTGQLTGGAGPAAAQLRALTRELARDDVQSRGYYDVSGFRAQAEVMIWWHAPTPQALQGASRALRRTAAGAVLSLVWAGFGVHRPAEFNRNHIPAFLAGAAPKAWAAVYPFVRSYQWYLLPESERRDLLIEHGRLGRDYPQVLTNTVAAFALGDYEWLLALEADQLHDIVDLMRELRAATARLHVREEVPFYTGRRIDEAEAINLLT
jgi:chlorite dismutase